MIEFKFNTYLKWLLNDGVHSTPKAYSDILSFFYLDILF